VQTAVDAKHHLIVTHEVTNVGNDRDQLAGMAQQAREAIGTTTLTAIADRGYFKGEEILACHEAGISALVPKTMTSGAKAGGRFDKADFIIGHTDTFALPLLASAVRSGQGAAFLGIHASFAQTN
jgi:transposase